MNRNKAAAELATAYRNGVQEGERCELINTHVPAPPRPPMHHPDSWGHWLVFVRYAGFDHGQDRRRNEIRRLIEAEAQ